MKTWRTAEINQTASSLFELVKDFSMTFMIRACEFFSDTRRGTIPEKMVL
jgi:hypothetical protein